LSSYLLKQLMINCQATFCTPFKVCQNWARFIRNVKLRKLIENALKIDYSGRNFNIVEKGISMTQFVFSWNTIQM
jgi:hypothetical protein